MLEVNLFFLVFCIIVIVSGRLYLSKKLRKGYRVLTDLEKYALLAYIIKTVGDFCVQDHVYKLQKEIPFNYKFNKTPYSEELKNDKFEMLARGLITYVGEGEWKVCEDLLAMFENTINEYKNQIEGLEKSQSLSSKQRS